MVSGNHIFMLLLGTALGFGIILLFHVIRSQRKPSAANSDNSLPLFSAISQGRPVQAGAVVDALGDIVSIHDRNLKLVYQNKPSKELFGDHVGEHCYSALAHRDRVCGGCVLVLTMEDGIIRRTERTLYPAGKARFIDFTASVLREPSGSIIGGVQVGRDITEHRCVEEGLRVNESRLDAL